MNIHNLVVADGLIKRITWKFGFAEVDFVDYLGTKVTLIFRKVVFVEIAGPCIGFELTRHSIGATSEKEVRFSFFDGDGNYLAVITQAGNPTDLCVVT